MSEKKEYLVASPGYVHYCGGIVVLHYLCSKLNERGYNAYITGGHMNSEYNTLSVNSLSQEKLRDLQHNGIIIYPDIVPHNPCKFTNVTKWWLGSTQPTPPNQLGFAFSESHQVEGCRCDHSLYLPPQIEPFFCEPEIEARAGVCAYSGKGNGMGDRPIPETGHFHTPVPGCTLIQAGDPPTREGLANLFKRSEVFYCYDNMSIVSVEARLCGTPVIMCGHNVLSKENYEKNEFPSYGMGYYEDKPDIQKLKAEIPLFKAAYYKRMAECEKDLDNFIEVTQNMNPDKIYVEDNNPDPNAHKIFGHQNFELFRTR